MQLNKELLDNVLSTYEVESLWNGSANFINIDRNPEKYNTEYDFMDAVEDAYPGFDDEVFAGSDEISVYFNEETQQIMLIKNIENDIDYDDYFEVPYIVQVLSAEELEYVIDRVYDIDTTYEEPLANYDKNQNYTLSDEQKNKLNVNILVNSFDENARIAAAVRASKEQVPNILPVLAFDTDKKVMSTVVNSFKEALEKKDVMVLKEMEKVVEALENKKTIQSENSHAAELNSSSSAKIHIETELEVILNELVEKNRDNWNQETFYKDEEIKWDAFVDNWPPIGCYLPVLNRYIIDAELEQGKREIIKEVYTEDILKEYQANNEMDKLKEKVLQLANDVGKNPENRILAAKWCVSVNCTEKLKDFIVSPEPKVRDFAFSAIANGVRDKDESVLKDAIVALNVLEERVNAPKDYDVFNDLSLTNQLNDDRTDYLYFLGREIMPEGWVEAHDSWNDVREEFDYLASSTSLTIDCCPVLQEMVDNLGKQEIDPQKCDFDKFAQEININSKTSNDEYER